MRIGNPDRCRLCCGLVVLMVGLLAFASSPAAAQGAGASIIGQVTDQSGAVLPGVTVTATSPALQVPQITAVTNEVGEYRLAPLPIGVYEVARSPAFSRSGARISGSPSASRRASTCSWVCPPCPSR